MDVSRGRIYWLVIFLVIATALIMRWRVITSLRVVSENMAPTLIAGDFALGLQKGNWRRGDVVWFNQGGRSNMGRVMGLPGDFVEYRSCQLSINGQNADLTRSDSVFALEKVGAMHWTVACDPEQSMAIPTQKVEDGKVLIMPDARYVQYAWPDPQIATDQIEGRAWLIWLSLSSDRQPRWKRILTLIH